MTQAERRVYLIEYLLAEDSRFRNYEPETMSEQEQKNLLRSLMNIRVPAPLSDEFLKIQNEYLKQELSEKGITDIVGLTPVENSIYLWQGDITTLKCDAIVNAANSQMLGCFRPLHNCIDNCIHTYSGIQLRNKCHELMQKQGYEEPTGQAKITPAFNLPCKYVIHTVGPIVSLTLTQEHKELLKSCYLSCLKLAEENGIQSIAFCCISTGVFGFEQEEAAKIAVDTVREYQQHSDIKVIFNVFKDEDFHIYQKLLGNQ
ncbi:MAG: protein-ADP-ribose hydrolase [Clostridia bacterium]|nr:protein-ADP-ribose hydrolase [Clostridia bacterium]